MARKLGTASDALISGNYLIGRSSNDAAKIGLTRLAVAPGPTRPLTLNERSPSLSTESLVCLSRPRHRPWASTSCPTSCLKQTDRQTSQQKHQQQKRTSKKWGGQEWNGTTTISAYGSISSRVREKLATKQSPPYAWGGWQKPPSNQRRRYVMEWRSTHTPTSTHKKAEKTNTANNENSYLRHKKQAR